MATYRFICGHEHRTLVIKTCVQDKLDNLNVLVMCRYVEDCKLTTFVIVCIIVNTQQNRWTVLLCKLLDTFPLFIFSPRYALLLGLCRLIWN